MSIPRRSIVKGISNSSYSITDIYLRRDFIVRSRSRSVYGQSQFRGHASKILATVSPGEFGKYRTSKYSLHNCALDPIK